jgi:hypothetical protein
MVAVQNLEGEIIQLILSRKGGTKINLSSLYSDGQQFHQYQQLPLIINLASLYSDGGQQFHQYQQLPLIINLSSLYSDGGQQFHQYQHLPLIFFSQVPRNLYRIS